MAGQDLDDSKEAERPVVIRACPLHPHLAQGGGGGELREWVPGG
jgi:hypothetical protein